MSSALSAETEYWIESRSGEIPVTLTMPGAANGDNEAPLVVLAHGHGGTRDENGGFSELAAMLADNGIASVRMDFPGCGDSTEGFIRNNMTNMLQDMTAVRRFAEELPAIDSKRVGLLGYSMGGRLALLAADHALEALVLWAPAGTNGPGSMHGFFGDYEAYRTLRSLALAHGSAVFVTPWGRKQELGAKWFTDLEDLYPLRGFVRRYSGPLLILHGAEDEIIPFAVSSAIAAAAPSVSELRFEDVPGAGHGLGFYTDNPDARLHVLESTVAFFSRHLLDKD